MALLAWASWKIRLRFFYSFVMSKNPIPVSVHWFRRDLRLADNPALCAALDAGLTFRPLAVTTRDTLDWYDSRAEEERANPRAGMSRDRETELLETWHDQG